MVSEAYASVLIGLRRHLWGEERLDDIEAKRMSSKLTPGRAPQAHGWAAEEPPLRTGADERPRGFGSAEDPAGGL